MFFVFYDDNKCYKKVLSFIYILTFFNLQNNRKPGKNLVKKLSNNIC